MANEVLTKVDTPQIRFFVTGSFSPAVAGTNWTVGSPTDVVLTLSAVANGAARQSTKVDLGALRAPSYEVLGCVDFTGETPSATGYIDYYWAPSVSGTAGTGNVAGNAGVDSACPDATALGSILLAEFLKMCQYIGRLATHDGAVVQNGLVSSDFRPSSRYGQLVVVNNSGDAFEADDVEMHQVFNPIVEEIQ